MRSQEEEKLYNSPWNIAVDFDVELSFAPNEIASMLLSYEKDCGTGMDIVAVSEQIYKFTNGYPYLVSRICMLIDNSANFDWSVVSVSKAVQQLLSEAYSKRQPLFDDITKNLEAIPELRRYLYDILFLGNNEDFTSADPIPATASMYGYTIRSENGVTRGCNPIFENFMIMYFTSKQSRLHDEKTVTGVLKQDINFGNHFNMVLCLEKLVEHFREIFTENDQFF